MERSGPDTAPRRTAPGGFTLVEMLVTTVILAVLLIVLFELSAGVTGIWKSSTGKISGFQSARAAFSTLRETLTRATLNTHSDYVSMVNGTTTFRTAANAATFAPTQFGRASELHFLSGPTVDIATAAETTSGSAALAIDATADTTPGDAIFFQTPLGKAGSSDYAGMNRALNSVGFYIQYRQVDQSLLPDWLVRISSAKKYNFQLLQTVELTENLQIYGNTSRPNYLLDWLTFAGHPRPRVLAENVLLLLVRPRINPVDEKAVAARLGLSYDEATQFGSVVCPNYHYDSRAWQTGYPAGNRVTADGAAGLARAQVMSNQLPPIVDVVMVCADALSLARFDTTTATPPAALHIPDTLFKNSAKLEADLTAYATQLSNARVRFHIARSSVEILGAKWSNK